MRDMNENVLVVEKETVTSARTGLGRTSLHMMVERGEFPQPIYLHPNGKGKRFVTREVDEWLLARMANRERGRAEAKNQRRQVA